MSIRTSQHQKQARSDGAENEDAGMRMALPRFSLPNWQRRMTLTVCTAVLAGLTVYASFKQPATLYEATARVLMLGEQEQYLIRETAVVADATSLEEDGEALLELLPLRSTALDIADEFNLSSEPYFARRSLLDRSLAFLGADLLVSRFSAQVADNVGAAFHIAHDPRKHTVKLTFRAPRPELAARVANRLADLYLARLKSNQQGDLQKAIDKLGADIDQLGAHRVRLHERIRDIQVRMNQTSLTASEPVMSDSDQLASLIAQERAQAGMLNRMLSRQREAETRLELDLLPPNARLLSKAVAPNDSLSDPAAFYGLLVTFILIAFNAVRWGLMMRREGATEAKSAAPKQGSQGERAQTVTVAQPKKSTAPRPNNRLALHRLALSGVGGHISEIARLASRHTSKRVILISEEHDWGGLGTDTVQGFARAGLRVVHVCLDETMTFNGCQSAKLRVGLADLVDELAKGGDLIHCDDETGVCSVSVGYRSLKSSDFTTEKMSNFIQALETVFDLTLIDLGPFYSDEKVLRSFGRGRSSVACIHAPLSDMTLVPQINDVMVNFGYCDSMILPLGPRFLKQRLAEIKHHSLRVAAE